MRDVELERSVDQRRAPRIVSLIDEHWRVAGALTIAVVLFGLSFANNPGGYLGTDTGGKTATLEAMTRRGDWSPDVGYWAEEWDPDGRYHPMYSTTRTDEGWIQVTSLPMVLAARPLWVAGGYRATLALPIAGTVLAALAAASLAHRLGSSRSARRTLLVTGLASPLVVYALDLWEHSLGVACVLWAAVLLFDGCAGRRSLPPLLAGALLALGSTMRTEALVYAVVGVAAACAWTLRSALASSVRLGILAVAGFAPVWVLNGSLESSLGGQSRADRASGAASSGFSELGTRAEEGLRTTFAMSATASWTPVVLGMLLAATVAAVAAAGDRVPADRRMWIGAAFAAFTIVTISSGLGFVPGLFAAFPVAAAGLAAPRLTTAARAVAAAALLALPVVWLFQFIGGAGPQWGGRYTLSSAALLGVVGVVVLSSEAVPKIAFGGAVAMSVAVTAFGVLWLGERSNEIVELYDDVVAAQDDVVIARNPFFLREAGPRVLDHRWLSVDPADLSLRGPLQVARDAGFEDVTVLQVKGDPDIDLPGTEVVAVEELHYFGGTFELVHLDLAG